MSTPELGRLFHERSSRDDVVNEDSQGRESQSPDGRRPPLYLDLIIDVAHFQVSTRCPRYLPFGINENGKTYHDVWREVFAEEGSGGAKSNGSEPLQGWSSYPELAQCQHLLDCFGLNSRVLARRVEQPIRGFLFFFFLTHLAYKKLSVANADWFN